MTSPLLRIMTNAALKAARGLTRDFGEVEQLQVSRKGPRDFVSSADLKAERVIREELQKARPGWGLLMEESGEIPGKDNTHRWIVDPLDGTTNFLHGLPGFCISIGLEKCAPTDNAPGELIAGVIYDPLRDEMFTAEKGGGAFVNNQRLRVSGRTQLQDCLFGVGGFSFGPGQAVTPPMLSRAKIPISSRCLGSAALELAYVAAGRLDGFCQYELRPWDIAAGAVLVREAGGRITPPDQNGDLLTKGHTLATNGAIHDEASKLILDVWQQFA